LIKYIKTDFLSENPMFSKSLLFDIWSIDSIGDLQSVIKTTELYIYLCEQERYPKELIDIKLIPHLPTHVPPQDGNFKMDKSHNYEKRYKRCNLVSQRRRDLKPVF